MSSSKNFLIVKPFFNSLERKFILIAMVMMIILSAPISYYYYRMEKMNHLNDAKNRSLLLTETIAISFINTLLYEELDLVEEGGLLENQIFDMLNNDETEIVDIVVLTPEKRVIAAINYQWYDKDYLSNTINGLNHLNETNINSTLYNGIRSIEIVMPLQIYGKIFGVLVTYYTLEKEYVYLANLRKRFVIFISIGVLCALALSIIIARLLAKPIKRLASEMIRVSDPYYRSRIITTRKDEIGKLEQGYLNMMERLKLADIEKEKSQKILIQTEKMATLGTLAAGLAHEINNPLGGIKNCLRRIEKNPEDAEQTRKYFELVNRAFGRIENLVKDLMYLSRKKEDQLKPLDLNELIIHTILLLEYQFQKNDISIIKDINQKLPLIWGNMDHVEQVLINLILNSIQAMPVKGELRLKTSFDTQNVIVMIIDNGIGIPMNDLNKIFDPFYSTKDFGKSTGLGLTICKTLVESLSGHIEIDSKVDEGTRIKLEFPILINKDKINLGISAAILAGGESVRMGTNKALLRLNEITIIEHIVNIIKKEIEHPLIITNSDEEFQFLNLPLVNDKIKGIGPIGGIYTALHHCNTTHCLVVACDLPFLNESVLRQLLKYRMSYDALIINAGEGVEPLCAIYSKSCLLEISKQIQEKNYRITDLFSKIDTKVIKIKNKTFGDFTKHFFNVNTPQDYKKAKELNKIQGT